MNLSPVNYSELTYLFSNHLSLADFAEHWIVYPKGENRTVGVIQSSSMDNQVKWRHTVCRILPDSIGLIQGASALKMTDHVH